MRLIDDLHFPSCIGKRMVAINVVTRPCHGGRGERGAGGRRFLVVGKQQSSPYLGPLIDTVSGVDV